MKDNKSKIEPKDLVKYGLNPYHWVLADENECRFEFINIDEPDLRFFGHVKTVNGNHQIIHLEWII